MLRQLTQGLTALANRHCYGDNPGLGRSRSRSPHPALFPIGLPLLANDSPERPRLQAELAMRIPPFSMARASFEGVSPIQASGKNLRTGEGQTINARVGPENRRGHRFGAASLDRHCNDRYCSRFDLVNQNITAAARWLNQWRNWVTAFCIPSRCRAAMKLAN